jgi:hypothetical protein
VCVLNRTGECFYTNIHFLIDPTEQTFYWHQVKYQIETLLTHQSLTIQCM